MPSHVLGQISTPRDGCCSSELRMVQRSVQPLNTWWLTLLVRAEAICDESLLGVKDADYRGCQNVTAGGHTCQRWDSQTPNTHDRTSENYPNSGLESNFCRNPDGEPTIWCYTLDGPRWGICSPRSLPLPPDAPLPPLAPPAVPGPPSGPYSNLVRSALIVLIDGWNPLSIATSEMPTVGRSLQWPVKWVPVCIRMTFQRAGQVRYCLPCPMLTNGTI